MNIRKLAMLPISITISLILALLILECGLDKVALSIKPFKTHFNINDSKTMAFFLPTGTFLLCSFIIEVTKFVMSSKLKKKRKHIASVQVQLNTLTMLAFMAMITGYIMKIPNDIFLKLSVALLIFYFLIFVCHLFGTSYLTFIFKCSFYFVLGLVMCFSYVRLFPVTYNMITGLIRRN